MKCAESGAGYQIRGPADPMDIRSQRFPARRQEVENRMSGSEKPVTGNPAALYCKPFAPRRRSQHVNGNNLRVCRVVKKIHRECSGGFSRRAGQLERFWMRRFKID